MRSTEIRLRDVRNTTTFRLTFMFGLVFVAGMVALLGLVYLQTARGLMARSDHILRLQAETLRAVPTDALPDRVRSELKETGVGLEYLALIGSDGERVAGNIGPLPGLIPDRPTDVETPKAPIRVLAIPLPHGETILVGRDISQIRALRETVLSTLAWGGGAILAAGLAAGLLLSLGPLRRVRDLQRASREIGQGDLTVRMPVAGRNDELDLFASTVNVMIEEVQRVVAQVKGVTDAVAHDLRTPLTRVRAALSRAQLPQEFQPVAAAAVADLDIVLERFAALLRIAELEAGSRRAGFGPTDLAALVERTVELYEPLAEERGQALVASIAAPATVLADEKLLFEAVSNLVDNAIKFTPEGGRILLALLPGPELTVSDTGPGIPAAERGAVLRRFHRGVGSELVPGSGLGLSVVAAIAHLHRLSLTLEPGNPGLVVRLSGFEGGGSR